MPDARAQQLVQQLRGRGLTDSAIGKAVGLNSSAVAQIAGTSARTGAPLARSRGAGYGAAATPALQAVVDQVAGLDPVRTRGVVSGLGRTGTIADARPRRQRKDARPARVRQSTRQVGRSGTGALLSGAGAGKGKAFDRLLARADRADQDVSIRVQMRMGDGSTQWITLQAAPASFWRELREGAGDDDGEPDELADWLDELIEGLASDGELSSELGDVIGYAVQVAA